MARLTRAAALVAVVGCLVPALPAGAATGARVLWRIADDRIDEASGIAVGHRSPGVLYVQNDSGDTNRFFALDERTGQTVATITVDGARNVDWEDIAVAPDSSGTSSVWLADIGDNRERRREVDVYRVREPKLSRTDRGRTLDLAVAQKWRLRYPEGPTNAESLAVSPNGVAYIVTKSFLGSSVVYRLPEQASAQVQSAVQVGTIQFAPTGPARGQFGIPGQLTATGATISRDGSLFAVRTYDDAYLWPLHHRSVPTALARKPFRVPLPNQKQGEGIAIDGTNLLLDSEGVHSRVYSVPIPAAVLRAEREPSDTADAATSRPTAQAAHDDRTGELTSILLGVGGLALALVVAGFLLGRRRRPGER